jgi:hypothetical protein
MRELREEDYRKSVESVNACILHEQWQRHVVLLKRFHLKLNQRSLIQSLIML